MNPEYPFQPQAPQPQPQAPQPQPQPLQPLQPQPQPQVQPQLSPQQQFQPNPAPHRHASPEKKWIIMTFVFIFTTLAFGGAFIWALVNYVDQKNNVDAKVSSAVSVAVKDQQTRDADIYAKAEKEPTRAFVGPEDYGRLAFQYPKTWSLYEASDASKGGTYQAYLNPGGISPVSTTQQYALRVTIEDREYDAVINSYASLVKKGDLTSSSVTLGEQNGTRLDGSFSKDVSGSAVILKIRDKTVTLRTDARTFTDDFNALIATITFNK